MIVVVLARDGTTKEDFKKNTYIRFDSNSSYNDWAYLRNIDNLAGAPEAPAYEGGPTGGNAIHLSLDFHDDDNDGRFSIRSVNSYNGGSAKQPTDKEAFTLFAVKNIKVGSTPSARVGIGTGNPTYPLYIADSVERNPNTSDYSSDDNFSTKYYVFYQNTGFSNSSSQANTSDNHLSVWGGILCRIGSLQ